MLEESKEDFEKEKEKEKPRIVILKRFPDNV